MTTDIDGGLEIRPGGPGTPWQAVELEVLLTCDYDAFGCLFGVRNYGGFVPVAAARGLPADISTELRRRALEDGLHDHTWIACHELRQVDWDEPAATVDTRIHEYRITDNGLVPSGKSAWSAALEGVAGPADPDGRAHPEGTEWNRGDLLWRAERMHRRDVLHGELRELLDRLGGLGAQYGEVNVRWVVWFES